MSEKFLCIYHADCADGFGAAWVVRKALAGKEVEFVPAHSGDDPPNVQGHHVVIVDFSYPRETLEQLHRDAASLRIIDHHKTAEAALRGLTYAHFNLSHSGAVLTWRHYFHADAIMPSLLSYLEDRDMWLWELAGSKQVSAALQSYPMEFEVWDRFMGPMGVSQLQTEGGGILQYQDQQVALAVQHASMGWLNGYNVPCINATHLISEIGAALAKGHPFSVCYFDTAYKRVYSLRSAPDGRDVSVIAKQYGGGGHSHAAGFTTNKPLDNQLPRSSKL